MLCCAACVSLTALVAFGGQAAPAFSATLPASPAPAPATSATIAPSLSSDRLGAKGALTLRIHFSGGVGGVPSPVRRSTISLPAGMSLEIPSLRSCNLARLRAHGPRACPPRSQIGDGHALVESLAGALLVTETIKLWVFLGPPQQDLQPTVEILAQGYTPILKRTVFTGAVNMIEPPYGEELAMSFPPIPTLPLTPNGSLVTFSLTVGASRGHGARKQSAVVVPSSCPTGGFPFAANFDYEDGSTGTASATIPCPS